MSPPRQVESKQIDPESELSSALRTFRRLAPMCSVEKRAAGIPQLAPQEKQLGILANEMMDTLLCISLATKGLHAVKDSTVKRKTLECIKDYERMKCELRDENAQQAELDCLNYLSRKLIQEQRKIIPTDVEELKLIIVRNLRLRQMENRLEMATKRFCIINSGNMALRQEIDRLLAERNDFNAQWNKTIEKLAKGKEHLMDIFEITFQAFAQRDECCTKLEFLKWKGLFELNKDIAEMQNLECELNHLSKLEEFLRVKGSRRICEADEIQELKDLEDLAKCEREIDTHDELIKTLFEEMECDNEAAIISRFACQEVLNFATFEYLCEVLQESVILKRDLELIRQQILDQKDFNAAREEREAAITELLYAELEAISKLRIELIEKNNVADSTIAKVSKGIDELVRTANCELTPLLALLGNYKEVTKLNVTQFLKVLETEAKCLVQVGYGTVKPPAPTPKPKTKGPVDKEETIIKTEILTKLVDDPIVLKLRRNHIENLVPYKPCAYCVEDYIMNLVFETPAYPCDAQYLESIFHLEPVNTSLGIFTLTAPAKRHPYRGSKKE